MYRIGRLELLAALATLGVASVPCASKELESIERSERARPAISALGMEGALRVRFFANGREYHLRLELNRRLDRWSSGAWHQYSGVIEGHQGSWARLAIAGNAIRGVVHDGNELLAMEPAEDGQLTVFRVADLRFPTPLSFTGDIANDPVLGPRKRSATAAPRFEALIADRKLEISLMGDASFRARYGSDDAARDAMLTRVNIVDGIFSDQAGVAIEVASVDLSAQLGAALDVSTDPPILLDSLGRLREQTSSLNSRGLTHLFTGRNLDGDSVGIAYSGTLCRTRYSASLAQAHNSATVDGLITAHEIAHVFGAPHDGEGECAATPQNQFIMSPVLNSQATTFSQCSLEQMAPMIAEAPCLEPVSPPDLALPASLGTHDANAGMNFDWRFAVTNVGGSASADARVSVRITPTIEVVSADAEQGGCVIQASLVTCDLPNLEAAGSSSVRIVVRSAAADTFSANAQVISIGDINRSNDEADGTLRVQASGSPPPPADADPPERSGGGALDWTLLGVLGALLGLAARRRFNPRAVVR